MGRFDFKVIKYCVPRVFYNEVNFMPNKPGPQRKIKYCPICKSKLKNVPREQMKSRYRRRDGTVAPHTHTYACLRFPIHRFEINQDR